MAIARDKKLLRSQVLELSDSDLAYELAYHILTPIDDPWARNSQLMAALTGEKVSKFYPGEALKEKKNMKAVMTQMKILQGQQQAAERKRARAKEEHQKIVRRFGEKKE